METVIATAYPFNLQGIKVTHALLWFTLGSDVDGELVSSLHRLFSPNDWSRVEAISVAIPEGEIRWYRADLTPQGLLAMFPHGILLTEGI